MKSIYLSTHILIIVTTQITPQGIYTLIHALTHYINSDLSLENSADIFKFYAGLPLLININRLNLDICNFKSNLTSNRSEINVSMAK